VVNSDAHTEEYQWILIAATPKGNKMPTLSCFYGIIVSMHREDSTKHSTPLAIDTLK